MCGICGVVLGPRTKSRVDRATVERMRDVITHRGPDQCGLFIEDGVGLGHRRLSIIDVAHGAQPFASDDGALQLIYNGEVYNHPELMRDLQQSGVTYHTRCDTETILRLYERHGTKVPELLRGMFAFAIWDRRRRELFLARDRLGIKPLYYALLDDGTLVFGSEIKAILASGLLTPALDVAQLPDFLASHAPSGAETLFAGVRRLPAGHTLTWRDGTIAIAEYWDLHFGPELEGSDAQLVGEYRDRFRDAVRLRLMSDVPLGMFLSGGIDSASITAMMSQLVAEPIKTFSVAFEEREANELEFARLVAKRYGTDHHEVTLSREEFFRNVPRLVWHEDEPMAHPSSVALNAVSELAAAHVKVVLTGEGSDETLAGYNRYRVTLYNMSLGRRYERMAAPAIRAAVKSGIEALPASVGMRQKLSRTFFTRPASLNELYFENFAVFGTARQARLLSAQTLERVRGIDPFAACERALAECDARSLLDRLLYVDTKTYLQELLMKQDQMSMAASIESRVPFLDHPLVEFAARLPQRLKLRGLTTKYVLRQAMAGLLPNEILERRKMGFPVPIGEWFRGPAQPFVDEFVTGPRALARGLFDADGVRALAAAHTSGEQKHGQRLWALMNLEIWHRIFIDGEAWNDVAV